MSGANSSVDTVNAAASAIISAESRVQQVTVPRRRWGACFSVPGCFGSSRHIKRINHAALVPEPISILAPDTPIPDNPNHTPSLTLPFVAPPSSPASFLNSEPTSSAQSPGGGFLSFSTLSANAYSPSGPTSIFAIGPYADETQLVSPPVFSNLTTEPNTAPFTPQMTTPSSPEVPFARLLSSSFDSNCKQRDTAYEFQSYHLYPGSPIGRLISPSSVCSGTSSPFIPDQDFHNTSTAPKILTAEALAERKLNSRKSQGLVLDGLKKDDDSAAVRVSFELTAEELSRCMEKKPAVPEQATREYSFMGKLVEDDEEAESNHADAAAAAAASHDDGDETRHESPERIESSGELVASKEFKFSNSDGAAAEPSGVGSEWWVNEAEVLPPKKWAFFPMVQPGVS